MAAVNPEDVLEARRESVTPAGHGKGSERLCLHVDDGDVAMLENEAAFKEPVSLNPA